MRHDGWAELLADDDHGGCMIPMLMLYHEHDEDPKMRPKTISPEQPEKPILHIGGWSGRSVSVLQSAAGNRSERPHT